MKILKVEKYNDILYIGTLNGSEYRKVGIRPMQLSSDFYLKEQIDVTVIETFMEIDGTVYYTLIVADNNNNILLQDMKIC